MEKVLRGITKHPTYSRIHKILTNDSGIATDVGFIKKTDGIYTSTYKETIEELLKVHFSSMKIMTGVREPTISARRLSKSKRGDARPVRL